MTIPAKTLLILETRMTGHRPSYVRRVAQIALSNAMHVVIAMPHACFEHPVAKQLLESANTSAIQCNQHVNVLKASNFAGALRREFQCRAFYQEALNKAKRESFIDIAIIPTFDDAAIVFGIRAPHFGDTPWLGIVMKQTFHFSAVGAIGPPASILQSIKHKLFIRLLQQLDPRALILTIDASLQNYIASAHPALNSRIAYIPDPVDERRPITNPRLREELGIPQEAFVILAYGSLRVKKGVPPLLEALHRLPNNVHALLVGTQAPEIKACVNSDQHKPLHDARRIHQINRYIDVSEDANFFTPANAIWLAYENYYAMSAVMVQAAQYERRTIATQTGLIGYLSKKYQTGLVVDNRDQKALDDAVVTLMNNEFSPQQQHYEQFARDFSLKAFESALLNLIDRVFATSS